MVERWKRRGAPTSSPPRSFTRLSIPTRGTIGTIRQIDFLQLNEGFQLADGAELTKTGPGVLLVNTSIIVGHDTSFIPQLGRTEFNGTFSANHPDASLALGGPGEEVSPDEIEFILNGDSRDYAGDLTVRDLSVSVRNDFALGSGVTTLFDGGRLVLESPCVEGNVVLSGGELVTAGGYEFCGTLTNGDQLSPGASPASLRIGGDFVQTGQGVMTMELIEPFLGQAIYGTSNDRLEVMGETTLDGTLVVELLYGFQPELGDSFGLFSFNGLAGQFAEIQLPRLNGGMAWDVSQLYTTGQLTVVMGGNPLTCDFDGNGVCELTDIDALTMELAASGNNVLYDVDGNGVVNRDDLAEWLRVAGGENLVLPI